MQGLRKEGRREKEAWAGEGAFVRVCGIEGVFGMRMVYMCMCVAGGGGGCQCCKSWCHWQEDYCRTITINLTNTKLMGGCICLVRDQSRRSYWEVLQRSPVCFQHHLDVAVSARCYGSHTHTHTQYTTCNIPKTIAKAPFILQCYNSIHLQGISRCCSCQHSFTIKLWH